MKTARGTRKKIKKFQIEKLRRQIMQVESMILEFGRVETEIRHEVKRLERSTRKLDPADVDYSLLAKAATERHANIRRSIIELERQLYEAKEAMAEAVGELEQIELIMGREASLQEAANLQRQTVSVRESA